MKFRAKVTSKAFLELLIQVAGTVARLAKACVLRVCPDRLCFAPAGPRAPGEARLWCEVRRGPSFRQFRMEGACEAPNEIHLELTAEHLARALRSAAGAAALRLQLTNRRRPCLTVAAELASRAAVAHDLPVRVLPRRRWEEAAEPRARAPDVRVRLPPLRTLRSIAERMARMGEHVLVAAGRDGRLSLTLETQAVSIRSCFRDLGGPQDGGGPESEARVRVDNRKLLQFLEAQQMSPTAAWCGVVSGALLHFVLVREDVSLQYSIPAS